MKVEIKGVGSEFSRIPKNNKTISFILSFSEGFDSAINSVRAVNVAGLILVSKQIPAFLKYQINANAPLRLFPSLNAHY